MQIGVHCGRISVMTDYQPGGGGPPPAPGFLLLEDGFYLLQEDGVSRIIL